MRTSIISLCVVATLLWAGATASAEGKGQGKGGAARTKERDPKLDRAQDASAATADTPSSQDKRVKPEKADKAGKAAKQADQGGPARGKKGGGSQGKKAGPSSETLEKGKGKGGQQQLQVFQKQLQHEQAKHMERQARLARIRELAVQKGNAETIARVDKLIAKEQEVYGRKLQQMQGQQRASRQPGAGVQKGVTPPAGPTDVNKPQGKVGVEQPKEAPAGDANEVMKDQSEPEQEKAETDRGAAGSTSRTKRVRTRDRQGEPKQ